MASPDLKTTVLFGIAAVLLVCVVYQYDSTLFGLLRPGYEGFTQTTVTVGAGAGAGPDPNKKTTPFTDMGGAGGAGGTPKDDKAKFTDMSVQGFRGGQSGGSGEGFADLASMEGPAAFAKAEAPAGCYPRDQLTPTELLPADQNTIYAQQNPMGVGSLKGKNFLSAGALIGVNTVGQSLRNANLQLRSEPPNPQVPVSIFLQSTIGPDVSHRPLEVGS